jgi:predicted transposase/invertase (TIGR01784 family)
MPKSRVTIEEVLERSGLAARFEAKGIVKGREKGLEEGLEKGAVQIARRLLKKGMSVEEVSEVTALDARKILAGMEG